MTLLSVVQAAADIIGIARPGTVIGNTDQIARQMLALVNREGKNLSSMRNSFNGGWSVLERVHTFSTSASEDEYDLPDDFGWLLGDTVWDRTNFWNVRGPLSPQDWQAFRSGLVNNAALRKRYRIRRIADGSTGDRKFTIEPEPDAVETVAFEYVTDQWVKDTAGTAFKTAYAVDTDVSMIDEVIVEMGLIWRFKQAKGLDFAADLAEYEIERDKRFAADVGPGIIEFAKKRFKIPPGIIPETGLGT